MDEVNEQAAASRIQSRQRGKKARKDLKEQKHAATKIQAVHRGKAARKHPTAASQEACTEEEMELAAFTRNALEPKPEPEPELESQQPLNDSDAERNEAWLTAAAEEAQVLSEVMSELLAENPELSQEQIQDAVQGAKGNRKVVPNVEFQEYAKEKLSTKNLDNELKQAAVAVSGSPGKGSYTGRPLRPKSVRGRAWRGGQSP